MMQRLETELFKTVVAATPLISMDLIVRNTNGQILLGLRNNRPAQGYWFVPGGRIAKDETFTQAFSRLTAIELGHERSIEEATFLGPYQHFYVDNFSGNAFSTHYVVLGYQLTLDLDLSALPNEQHQGYQWWSEADLLQSDHVHVNTKAYFSHQYK
ncbi:GDP-mannose mannosyl hydrolase [Salinivibrio sp. ML323]|uniref:GDP-mannose mannosyl hydrolase n=1 Tax=Salinivibrio sp. ML323 TaxID=1909474 RepID=UPI000986C47C|nr:GDP-mannose mannosyl hydrolase [Salinivibrio sp. ML323]OOE56166.1 GDP-mannose mannosyl hydrolase [Salinivibrio sp. ML323]